MCLDRLGDSVESTLELSGTQMVGAETGEGGKRTGGLAGSIRSGLALNFGKTESNCGIAGHVPLRCPPEARARLRPPGVRGRGLTPPAGPPPRPGSPSRELLLQPHPPRSTFRGSRPPREPGGRREPQKAPVPGPCGAGGPRPLETGCSLGRR